MKIICVILFVVIQYGVFGQQSPKSNLETDSCNFSNVRVNGVDLSQTNCGEASLILYLNEKSDEELLKILKEQLIVGEIVYKKKD
jgi:hypothetical protein